VYSNADGTVQYVVMREVTGSDGESFWQGNLLTTTGSASGMQQFQFPSNLPSQSTASRSVLIATSGFAALGLVAPDYTVSDHFLPTAGGTLSYASGVDQIALPALPSDGATAIDRNGTHVPATPKNFAGATAMLTASAPVVNYQGLWWNSPAESESGWGINLTEQRNVIFGTWFTYDLDGSPLWLSVTATNTAPGVFLGTLFRTTGPPFGAVPFDPAKVVRTPVGTATFTFSDGNDAMFAYTVNGISQTKAITRQVFVVPGTVCQDTMADASMNPPPPGMGYPGGYGSP
jgi:hypothetical protein